MTIAGAMKPAKLREFAKHRGVICKKGACCILMFVDQGQPISQLEIKPHFLRVEEDKRAWGRFYINDPYACMQQWIFAPYYREMGAFCYVLPPEIVHLGTILEGLHYYTHEERENAMQRWAHRQERDEWLENVLKNEAGSFQRKRRTRSWWSGLSPLAPICSSEEKRPQEPPKAG